MTRSRIRRPDFHISYLNNTSHGIIRVVEDLSCCQMVVLHTFSTPDQITSNENETLIIALLNRCLGGIPGKDSGEAHGATAMLIGEIEPLLVQTVMSGVSRTANFY